MADKMPFKPANAKFISRAIPCAPQRALIHEAGAHGVTLPTVQIILLAVGAGLAKDFNDGKNCRRNTKIKHTKKHSPKHNLA